MRINREVKNINILGKLSKLEIENQRVGFFFPLSRFQASFHPLMFTFFFFHVKYMEESKHVEVIDYTDGKYSTEQWFSKSGSWTSSISITWELVRNTNSQALLQTH